MAEKLSVIGKSLPRKDALEKVTGQAKYTADIKLPSMLYGMVLRSPYPHANIVDIDTSKAEALPGVEAVLTHKDVVPKILFRNEWEVFDMYILDDKVRYVGDEVAAVAAVSERIAEEALSLIDVKYEMLPAVFHVEEALRPEAPQVHPGGNLVTPAPGMPFTFCNEVGSVEKRFADADYIFEKTFTTHIQSHFPMEPRSCVASWGPGDELTMWDSTQSPSKVQEEMANALNLPMNKVRVIAPYVGGAFGCKITVLKTNGIAALLAKKAGKPVKIQLSREEQAVAGMRRYTWIFHLKVGVKRDGSLTAYHAKAYNNVGAYIFFGIVICMTQAHMTPLYSCPNRKYESYAVYTNCPPGSAFRGFGYLEADFAIGSLMDEIAEKLGMNPLEFHLKNHVKSGEPYGMANIPRQVAFEEAIRKGAERIGWKEKWHKAGERTLSNGKKHGMGMGMGGGYSGIANSGAVVRVYQDGSVQLLIGAAELGQGCETQMAQICAEALGVCYEDVQVTRSDTQVTPFDFGQLASRTTLVVGNAVKQAAEDAKRQLLDEAAIILEAGIKELETKEGWIYVKKEHQKRISVADVAYTFIAGRLPVVPPKGEIIGKGSYTLSYPAPVANAIVNFAEVAVDTETGAVGLLRYVTAVDCGRAVNPAEVEGQCESVLSGGLGFVLSEELLLDHDTGRVLNPNFLDYKIPTALDYRELDPVIIIETNEPLGPFGAKGLAEATLSACAPAISNAIYNAIGVRVSAPITPEKVLKALGKI